MKMLKYAAAALTVAATVTACSGDKSNPKTITPDDLNLPTGLVTMTGSEKITLRWQGNNTEDEFQGYDVFVVKKTVTEVKAIVSAPYPTGVNLASGSIPRCSTNSAIFVAFGLPANDKDCEGAKASDTGASLAETDTAKTDTTESETLTGIVKCATDSSVNGTDAVGNANISLPASGGKSLGENVCVVDSLSDGTALENGATYTFFVAAIMGSDFNNMSWTSSFVEDTPRPVLFSGDVKIASTKYIKLPADKILAFKEFTADDITTGSCSTGAADANICNQANANGTAGDGIYIGRRGPSATFNYPQRLILSSTGAIALELLGSQTDDPDAPGEISDVTPGDEAADTTTYSAGGKFVVYGDQVFDMKFTASGKTHYGKIVIHIPTLSPASDEEAEMTVKMTVFVQTAVDNRHYFQ